jgi:hypothetical protein
LQNVTSVGSQPLITLIATTRIVINFLFAATNVKQNRIIAAQMNAEIQVIKEKLTTDS